MSFDKSKTLKLKICLETEKGSTIIFEYAKKKKNLKSLLGVIQPKWRTVVMERTDN